MSGRTWRLPILLIVPLLLAGAFVYQDRHPLGDRGAAGTSAVGIAELIPTVADPGALSSTWYCAAGTATGEAGGFAEQQVIIANSTGVDATGYVTAMPESAGAVSRPIAVPANGRTSVRVSDLVKAPWASVLVEVSGGGISVIHELRGPQGRSVSACASTPSSTWYFPAGTTVAGARSVIALFNPFPGEATVDIAFDTEDGARTPQQLQGMVVPGGRVVTVDVSSMVTLRERVATTVSARVGRIVAEQVQSSEGRNGGDQGLSATLGATSAASVWTFPTAAPSGLDAGEFVAFFNPGDADVEVEVQVVLDDQGSNGAVEPFRATVPAHRSVIIDLFEDFRIPRNVGRWMIARSIDGGLVVAERWLGAPRGTNGGGLTLTMGVPVGASTWIATMGTPSDSSASSMVVVNPSATQVVTVGVKLRTKGRVTEPPTLAKVRIAPGGRFALDTDELLVGRLDSSIEIVADGVVVCGLVFATTTPVDLSALAAFPQIGTEQLLIDVVDPAEMPDPLSFSGVTTTTASTTTTSTTTTTVAPAAGPVVLPGT